jgi:hypothetical protein
MSARKRRDNVMGYGAALGLGGIGLAVLGATTDLDVPWWPLVSLLGVALFAVAYLSGEDR